MSYLPTIGLEIHVGLDTETKMFCDCHNDSLERHPNVHVCPICMGHPGTLPVANKRAVEFVILLGMAVGGEIADHTHFDRKSYTYPDLPKGYQISQYDEPIVRGGELNDVRIRRVHLEEDTGSLAHTNSKSQASPNQSKHGTGQANNKSQNYSLVDYNRAGVPLMELVTEPDIKTTKQAVKFAKELQLILRYLGVSEAKMESKQMRVEANISIRPTMTNDDDNDKLGTKVEIKNLNSFKAVEGSIEYELKRQEKLLEEGGEVVQETRGWDPDKQKTVPQRGKESAHDYRYFPEPDLPPLNLEEIFDTDDLRDKLPELPQNKRKRFKNEYDFSEKQVRFLAEEKSRADYFEATASELLGFDNSLGCDTLYNYFSSDLRGLMRERSETFEDLQITPESFAHLVYLVEDGEISSRIAKDILVEMFETGEDPETIKREGNYDLISGEDELESIAEDVIEENEDAVEDYRSGKEEAIQFLVGQIMAKTQGQADPEKAREVLKNLLS